MKSNILRFTVAFGAAALIHDFTGAGFAQTGIGQVKPPQSKTVAQTQPVLKGFPFTNESLSYTVNWPSGLSLGEAHLSATAVPDGWRFEMGLDAGIPGFTVKDTYKSSSSGPDLCSVSFSKDWAHGAKKGGDTVAIDQATSTETRTPANSDGVAKHIVPACIRDALTFLYYARREMGQGRVPVAQEIIFGATYNGSFQYAGAETIPVGDKPTITDKLVCHIKGPASDIQFDAYFDRDPARTPVSVRVPLPLGKFSLEIVR
jgi:hypothetical protein